MGLIKDFKEFAMRGNVVDMAVGVIIGGAFGTIVNSVINDLIMPVVGKAIGNVDFSNLYVPMSDAIKSLPNGAMPALVEARKLGPVFAYGNFITVAINFLILAFCIFMMIKLMMRMTRKKEAAPATPPAPSKQEVLLEQIRDLLKAKS